MIVFLLFSVPLWFLFLNTYFKNEGVRKRDFSIPLSKGSVIYIIALLISWLFTSRLRMGLVTPLRVFGFTFFSHGLTSLIWLAIYLPLRLISAPKDRGYRLREIMLIVLPLFLGDAIYRSIIRESWYGIYEIFLLPLSGMSQLIILTVILERMERGGLVRKLLCLFSAILVLLLFNVIPSLVVYKAFFFAIFMSIGLFVLSFFVFLWELGGDLPLKKN